MTTDNFSILFSPTSSSVWKTNVGLNILRLETHREHSKKRTRTLSIPWYQPIPPNQCCSFPETRAIVYIRRFSSITRSIVFHVNIDDGMMQNSFSGQFQPNLHLLEYHTPSNADTYIYIKFRLSRNSIKYTDTRIVQKSTKSNLKSTRRITKLGARRRHWNVTFWLQNQHN